MSVNKYRVDDHIKFNLLQNDLSNTITPFGSSFHEETPFGTNNYNLNPDGEDNLLHTSTFERRVDEYLNTKIKGTHSNRSRAIDEKYYTALPEIKTIYKSS